METINEVLKKSILYELLGAEGIAELRSKVIDVIVDTIRSDFEQNEKYILSPEDISSDIYDDIKNEVLAEIKDEYKERVKTHVDKKFKELGI